MDLSNLGLSELQAMQRQVKNEIARRESGELAIARKQILEIARSVGLPLKDLFSSDKLPTKKVAKRFRHPQNPTIEWTGRGRSPRWVVLWLAAGHSIDELRIES
jgi:DNA-binding protein H-NS